MKWKIKHKTEGWTGTLELEEKDVQPKSYSSHRQAFEAQLFLTQDSYKPDGTYVEDPDITDLSELEMELIK